MPAVLLKTKLYIPTPRAERVPRSQLLARLDQALTRTLTLVAAPAGFGKTTLLAQWIGRNPLPVAWVSLDKGDNDPVRFWSYVSAAFNQARPGLGEAALAVLRFPQPPPIEMVLTQLIDGSRSFSG